MSKIEGPQVMAAILALALIAVIVVFVAPDSIKEVVGAIVTGIGMLGMKLVEKNGNSK